MCKSRICIPRLIQCAPKLIYLFWPIFTDFPDEVFSPNLKVVVRACYGAFLVAHVFKYLAPNFVSGKPA